MISAYEQINGVWYYNPNNDGGIENFKNLPVNPGSVAVDYETGKTYYVNPSNPSQTINITPTPAYSNEQIDALSKLSPVKVMNDTGTYSYDTAKYLRTNPGDEQTLVTAGISQSDIEKSKQANEAPVSASTYREQYFQDKGWEPDRNKLIKNYDNNRSADNLKQISDYDKHLNEASESYIKKYGMGDFLRSGAGEAVSFLTVPAFKAIEPGGLENVTPSDWAWTAGIIATVGILKGAGKLTSELSGVNKAAKLAGRSNQEMKAAISELNKTALGADNYAKVSSKAQLAIQKAKVADQKFITEFDKVNSLSNKELSKLEKASKINGLKGSVKDVNKAEGELNKAWDKLDKSKIGTKAYSENLNNINEARSNLDNAMRNLNGKLSPRASHGIPAGYDRPIQNAENKIKDLDREMKTLERKIKTESLPSKKADLNTQWVEARDSKNMAEWEREALYYARAKGMPAPEVQRYIVKNKAPSKQDLADLFNQFSRRPSNQPLKDVKEMPEFRPGEKIQPGKKKVAVITKERTVEKQQGFKLEAEYKKPEFKPEGKKAPKIVRDNKVFAPRPTPNTREVSKTTNAVSNQSLPGFKEKLINSAKNKNESNLKTSSVNKVSTKTNTNTRIKESDQNKLENKIQPQPQAKTQTKTQTKTGTSTKTKTEIKLKTIPPKISSGKYPPFEIKGSINEKSRSPKKLKKGSLAWEQGRLKKGEVVYFEQPPDYKKEVMIGRYPQGYRDTGDTPRSTIQTIPNNSRVKKTVTVNMGITRAIATPDEKKIRFVPTNINQTTRPISERMRGLSRERMPGISGRKFPRITPRMGRLR